MAKRKSARKIASEYALQAPRQGLAGRFAPVLAPVAAVGMLLGVVELVLSALVSGTSLRNDQLSVAARVSLAAYAVTLAMAGVAIVAAIVGLLGRLNRLSVPPAISWVVLGVQALVVWVAALLYGASWTAFWNAGVFLDRAAFLFWLPQPIQVFHWIYPPLAIGIVAETLVAAFVLGWLVPRSAARMAPDVQRRLVTAGGGCLGICLAAAAAGGFAYGGEARQSGLFASPFAIARDQRTGPVVRAVADLRDYLRPVPPVTPLAGAVEGSGRPIISMEQYLAAVDRNAIRPMNVVMVQFESLRSDQLRAYGGTRDVMPTVDALARDARVFRNAYVQASHSNYTDVVPLSSHYPLRYREMYEYPENPPYPRVLIYDVLKAIGYKTAVISSQNEHWGGMINYHRPESLDKFFHAAVYSGPTYSPFEDAGFADWVKETGGAGSVDDSYTVDEAIRWVDSIVGSPFFLHMNLQSSHVPYVVPQGFTRPFGRDRLDFTIMWGKFPLDQVQAVKDRYADSLFYEDMQIARLFERLRQLGVWDNTIVIIGGDNGEAFYEHGIAAHASTVYDEVVKVPMIVRVPGVAPGQDGRPAMFLDVPPTLLDALGLPAHPSFQGISLLAPNPDPDRPIFTMVQTPLARQTAVIRGGFKLIHSESEGFFLYDLTQGESVNVGTSHLELVDELSVILSGWREKQLAYYADTERQRREYPP